MAFDPQDYLPKPNNWFETEIAYEGKGRATFSKPEGWIEGHTTIHFDETGDCTAEMEIEEFGVAESLGTKHPRFDDLPWLLSGRKPHKEGLNSISVWSISTKNNMCNDFTVDTPYGTFEATDEIDHNGGVNFMADRFSLRFSFFRSQYIVKNNSEPRYWVVPLINMVYEPRWMPHIGEYTELTHHPLRVFKVAEIPDTLSEEEKKEAIAFVRRSNWLEYFVYNNKPGFIEVLPDFHSRREQLQSGERRKAVTAIMVGEIGSETLDFETLKKWKPLDYLHWLSLATGSFVGMPWIELRNAEGDLVKRFHTQQWQSSYLKGHYTINNFCSGGIGYLLTKASNVLDADMRTAIRLTVQAGFEEQMLDDRKVNIFRAWDTLTQKHRSTEKPQVIDSDREKKIKEILQEASTKIHRLKSKRDKPPIKSSIQRIMDRVKVADDPGTISDAEAVLQYVHDKGLHDAEVICREIALKKKWISNYKRYRSAVIHEGRLKFDDDTEIKPAFWFACHLHDMLLRVFFNLVDYDGQYKRVLPIREKVSVDWVKPDTSPEELGYK